MNLKLLILSFSLFSLSLPAFANDPPPNTVQCSPVSKSGSSYQIDCTNSPSYAFYCTIGYAHPRDRIFFLTYTGQEIAGKTSFSNIVEFVNSVSFMPTPDGKEMHFLLQVFTDSPHVGMSCAAGTGGRQSY